MDKNEKTKNDGTPVEKEMQKPDAGISGADAGGGSDRGAAQPAREAQRQQNRIL